MRTLPLLSIFCVAGCGPAVFSPNTGGGGDYAGAPATGDAPADQQAGPPPEQLQGASLGWITNDADEESNPAVSPDGQTLLFVDWTNEVVDGQYTGNVASRTLVGIGVDGSGGRTVYTSSRSGAYSPRWTIDGKGFVFMSDSMGAWNLVKSLSRSPNAATSVVVRASDAPSIGTIDVSPAGGMVAFDAELRGVRQIVTSGLDGSSFTVLTDGENPRFSPDGTRIAFDRADDSGVTHIYLIDAATGDNLVQLTSGDSSDYSPDWSPDGTAVVFSSNYGWNQWTNGSASTTANLFTVLADGTGLTQVTTGIATSRDAEWGGDGWIYFSSNDAGNFDLYRVAAP